MITSGWPGGSGGTSTSMIKFTCDEKCQNYERPTKVQKFIQEAKTNLLQKRTNQSLTKLTSSLPWPLSAVSLYSPVCSTLAWPIRTITAPDEKNNRKTWLKTLFCKSQDLIKKVNCFFAIMNCFATELWITLSLSIVKWLLIGLFLCISVFYAMRNKSDYHCVAAQGKRHIVVHFHRNLISLCKS